MIYCVGGHNILRLIKNEFVTLTAREGVIIMSMRELVIDEAVKLGFIRESQDRLLFHSTKDVYICINSDEELAEDLIDPNPDKFSIVSIGHGSGYDQEIEPGFMVLSSTGKTTPADWLRSVVENSQPK